MGIVIWWLHAKCFLQDVCVCVCSCLRTCVCAFVDLIFVQELDWLWVEQLFGIYIGRDGQIGSLDANPCVNDLEMLSEVCLPLSVCVLVFCLSVV
jgi:hypothetical protein